jgi:hypothetical protein
MNEFTKAMDEMDAENTRCLSVMFEMAANGQTNMEPLQVQAVALKE